MGGDSGLGIRDSQRRSGAGSKAGRSGAVRLYESPIPNPGCQRITPGKPGAGLNALLRSMAKVRCLVSSGVATTSPLRL